MGDGGGEGAEVGSEPDEAESAAEEKKSVRSFMIVQSQTSYLHVVWLRSIQTATSEATS